MSRSPTGPGFWTPAGRPAGREESGGAKPEGGYNQGGNSFPNRRP